MPANTEIERPTNVNENIELDVSVKVCAEIMQEYLDGRTETCDSHIALRQWEDMQ